MRLSDNNLCKYQLLSAIEQLDEDQVLFNVKALISNGADSYYLQNLLNEGMQRVGKLYETGEYFIADLILSGEIYKKVLNLPEMQITSSTDGKCLGRVLIGTAHGDVHDIGKVIVICTLSAYGYEVIDLGVDVSPKTFVQEAKKYQPDIIAISGVMSFAVGGMEITIRMLEENNLRKNIKVIVGGPCVNNEISRQIGADAYSDDPIKGVMICKRLLEKRLLRG